LSVSDKARYARDKERILARQATYREKHRERWSKARRAEYAASPLKQTRAIWRTMIARCVDPKHDAFPYYGGTGIAVCSRWRESFDAFLEDMGLRPPGLSINRINTNGNYEPGNCEWATRDHQMKTRRLCAHQVPSCLCGSCPTCKARQAARKYKALLKRGLR
jgi:hypothetical protein